MTYIAWAQAAARMESTKRAGNQESVPANDPRSVPVTLRALPGRLSCCNCWFVTAHGVLADTCFWIGRADLCLTQIVTSIDRVCLSCFLIPRSVQLHGHDNLVIHPHHVAREASFLTGPWGAKQYTAPSAQQQVH